MKDAVSVDLEATCKDNAVDAAGNPKLNPRIKSVTVQIKGTLPPGLALPPADKPHQQLGCPEIGELVTDIAVYDVESRFVVIDIKDHDSGLRKDACQFFAIATNNPQQAPDELVDNAGVTHHGKFLNMKLEGPENCRGVRQGDIFNGPCSAQVRHKYETLLDSSGNPISTVALSIRSFVVCENKANPPKKTTKEFDIKIRPRGS